MFEVSVAEGFVATHQLRLLDGTWEPLHRHNWRVTATFAGPKLGQAGVLLDFESIRGRMGQLLATLHDHKLNDLAMFVSRNPSAENVAVHIAEQLGRNLPDGVRLRCVEVEEAPGCVVRFIPEPS
jgi:6-pyruvoyltetrahydropterin/6-carboxytetrahydropterin synthase